MDDADRFEWDSRKAVANLKKHDVTFDQAIKAFHDPYAFEKVDEREGYGEERINLIGMCDGMILCVTYTEAKRYERDDYYRKNAT